MCVWEGCRNSEERVCPLGSHTAFTDGGLTGPQKTSRIQVGRTGKSQGVGRPFQQKFSMT